MRQRGGIILAIVFFGTSIALAIWLTWKSAAALCIYAGAMLAVIALVLLSIWQTPVGTDRDREEEDASGP
jgi:hypothetical protein